MFRLNKNLSLNIEYFKQEIEPTTDVTIVGGGFVGLYYAYKIIHTYPHLKICLLEKNTTLGGSLSTRFENNFILDFGSNLFDCGPLRNFVVLANALSIELEQYVPKHSNQDLDINLLNEKEKKEFHENTADPLIVLLKYILRIVLSNQWNYGNDVYDNDQKFKLDLIRRFGKYKDVLLSDYSFYNILREILSPHAFKFIISSLPPQIYCTKDSNAADYLCFVITYVTTFEFIHIRPKRGSYDLVEKLCHKIKDKVDILLNHNVYSIAKCNDLCQRISINSDVGVKSLYTKKTIICTDIESFLRINGIPMDIKSIFQNQLFSWNVYHIFVICKNTPWHEQNVLTSKHFPNTRVITKFDKSTGVGLLEISGNSSSMAYWKGNINDKILEFIKTFYPLWNDPIILKVVLHSIKDITSGICHELCAHNQFHKFQKDTLEFSLHNNSTIMLCTPPQSPEIRSIDKLLDVVHTSFDILKKQIDKEFRDKRYSLDAYRS